MLFKQILQNLGKGYSQTCVRVRACERERERHYANMHVCVCVCVCMCECVNTCVYLYIPYACLQSISIYISMALSIHLYMSIHLVFFLSVYTSVYTAMHLRMPKKKARDTHQLKMSPWQRQKSWARRMSQILQKWSDFQWLSTNKNQSKTKLIFSFVFLSGSFPQDKVTWSYSSTTPKI